MGVASFRNHAFTVRTVRRDESAWLLVFDADQMEIK